MNTAGSSEAVFDRASALQRLQGDEELLREVIEIFLTTSPRRLEEVRNSVAAADAALIARSAHSLKSAVGNFSAKPTGEAALRLEMIGREGRVAEAADALADLEQELVRLQAVLRETLITSNEPG